MDERIAGKTKHGEITVDQLAQIQPGMARLMDEISRRFYYLYYAAKGGNWPMARHQYNETISIMNIVKVTRPKYTQDMESFEKHHLSPVLAAIGHKDWKEFELAYKYNYSYIRFVIPSKPPEHMDFGPPEKFSRKK
jgi:hypothetical protein